MKIKFIILLLFIIFYAPWVHAVDPKLFDLEQKPLPNFIPPPIQTHEYNNKPKLYFLENNELPIFEMTVLMKMGTIYEPQDKIGITKFMMEGIRTGGSQTLKANEVDLKLEETPATITVDTNREFTTITLKCLVKDVDTSLALFFDILSHPQFDSNKLEIIRQSLLEEIRQRFENPAHIASINYRDQIYHPDNVWARRTTTQTINSITREDILNYYQKYVSPKEMIVGVSGNIPLDKLEAKLDPYFNQWTSKDVVYPSITPLEKKWDPSIQMIEAPIDQSTIILGHFGDKRFNPDKYAIILANHVLGGSTFGSRLGYRIRTQLGLAYGINSSFGLDTDYGIFQIVAATKSASTIQVVKEAEKILADFQRVIPVTAQEVNESKDTILSQLIFEYEDPFEIVESRMNYDFYGYPPDYLTIFQREIKNTTLEQVQKVIPEYFFPDKLKVLIVGNPQEMPDLKELGTIEKLPFKAD